MNCFVLFDALTDDLGLSRIKRAKTNIHNDHASELGLNTEASADDLGLTQAQVDGDKVSQTSACEIPTLSHADVVPTRSLILTRSSYNDQHLTSMECSHTSRGRSQPVQFDRGPNGHIHQTDDADL